MDRTTKIITVVVLAVVVGGQGYRLEMSKQRESKLAAAWPGLQKDVLGSAATMKDKYPAEAAEAENACQGSYTHDRLIACEAQQDKIARLTWDLLQTKDRKQFLVGLGVQAESDCSGTYTPERFDVCEKDIEHGAQK